MGPSKYRRGLLLLLALAAVAAAVAFSVRERGRDSAPAAPRTPGPSPSTAAAAPPLPTLRFDPAPGATLAYRVRYESDGEVDLGYLRDSARPAGTPPQGETLPSAADALLEGVLLVRVLAGDDGERLLALRLLPGRCLVNGREIDDAVLLDRPFLACTDDRGQVRRLEFPPGIPAVVSGLCRSVVESMRVVLPEGGEAEWRVEEEDLLGSFVASHRRAAPGADAASTVEKAKVSYAPPGTEGPGPLDVRVRVDASLWTFRVIPGSPWIQSVEGREAVHQASRGRTFAKSAVRFSAHRVEPPADAALAATEEEARRALRDRSLLRLELTRTRVELNVVTLPWKTKDAVDAFRKGFGPDYERVRDLVVNWLRQEPARAAALVEWLDGNAGTLPLDVELGLWRAVAVAGTPEAQTAFARALTDPAFGELAPYRAVAHATDFVDPGPALLDALWTVYRSHRESREGNVRALSSSALYAIGALGDADRLDPAVGVRIAADLATVLREAAEPRDREVALAAIGNHGGGLLLDAVEPWFASDDPDVRAKAFQALRRMEGPDPVAALLRHYRAERSAGVRTVALETLREIPGRAVALPFAREEILRAESDGARVALVHLLGEDMGSHEGNEAALRAVLRSGASQRVRKAVYEYVKP